MGKARKTKKATGAKATAAKTTAAKTLKAPRSAKAKKLTTSTVHLSKPENAKRLKQLDGGSWSGYYTFSEQIECVDTYDSPGFGYVGFINDVPAGTTLASAWATEDAGGYSHFGDAVFATYSVQLDANGTRLRVVFGAAWPGHGGAKLNCGVQVMFG